MIPTHSSDKTNRREIIVNKLSTLNEYDFSEPHRHNYFEFFCFVKLRFAKGEKLDAKVTTAEYGEIVDLSAVDWDRDVVFTLKAGEIT